MNEKTEYIGPTPALARNLA